MYKDQRYDEGDVILSIGAFARDTLEKWQAHTPCLVVDYEAGPETYQAKVSLTAQNPSSRGKLECHPEAVTDVNGKITLHQFRGGPMGDSVCSQWQDHVQTSEYFAGQVEVNTVSMASVLRRFPRVRECYMNCEGSEIPILLHTPLDLLGRCQYICVEFHRFSSFLSISNGDVLQCVERLRPLFDVRCIEDYHPAYEFIRKPEVSVPSDTVKLPRYTRGLFWTDIDSTMTDHWKRIRRWTRPRWPGSHIDSRAWTEDEILSDRLLPHCAEVLWRIRMMGFEIGYLSARAFPQAAEITRKQLAQFSLPNTDNIHLVHQMSNKVEILRARKVQYYVDDFLTGQEHFLPTYHDEVVRALPLLGIQVLVFRNDWEDIWEQFQLLAST